MKLIKIGRTIDNDFVIESDSTISRNHAEVFIDDENRIFITDLNSSNGTFINGLRIYDSQILNENDVVLVGNTKLNWEQFLEKQVKKDQILEINHKTGSDRKEKLIDENEISFEYINLISIITVVIAFVFVFLKYDVNDFFAFFDLLGVLFLPITIAFIVSKLTKKNFEVIFTICTIVILGIQYLIF